MNSSIRAIKSTKDSTKSMISSKTDFAIKKRKEKEKNKRGADTSRKSFRLCVNTFIYINIFLYILKILIYILHIHIH
jgi:hypothetical protein